jgi:hypothetical protein
MGQGGKEGAQDVADEYEDIMVDAGGDAGTAGGEAAGQAFMDKFLEAFNDLKQKFVDLVLDSVKGSMDKAVEDMQNALDDQRDAALEVFDTQLKAIESLEKAEESLTKEKEYQANRRKMLEERELQRANYIRNRALAIYEGRIDDARMLNLEEQKNTIDFNQNLAKTDEERRKDLVKENLETLKDSIKKAQEDTKKLLDDQIKAFQDAAAEITKFPPQTIEEYQNQINQLNSVATATASENGAILRNMMNSMRENLVMPNENLGVFATSLDQLVVVAQQKYGLTGEPGDNTIVGATIGMLAGIQGQIVDNTENITAAFDGIVTSIFDTASTIGNIGTEIITPALDAMATIFTENNPAAIFEEAFAFANESIRREWEKTVGHVSSKVDELTKHIEDSLVQILAAQTQMGIVAGGGAGGAGGVAGGTRSQGDHDGDGGTATGGQVVPGNLTDSLQRSIGPFVDSFISSNALLNNLSSSAKATLRANSVQRIKEIGAMFVTNKTPQQRGAILSFYKDAITGNLRKVVDAFLIENFGYGFYNSSINTATTQSGPRLNPSRLFNGGRVRLGYGGMKVPGFSSQGVPAILHGGEYVVSSKALSNLGIATLESINSMRYAQPGGVSAPGSTMVTENKNIYISVENFIGEDEWFNSMLKKYNMTVLPKNQKSAGMENRVITSYNGLSRGL